MANDLVPITHAHVDAIMNSILDDGVSLRDAVKKHGLTLARFNEYLKRDREAALAVARAQEFRADVLVDEALHLADGNGDPAKVRNQIAIRQWAAARFNQKRYGDRVDLNVTQTIDVGATLQEARARLSARYQQGATTAQTIDLPSITDARANDCESRAPIIPPEKDAANYPGAAPDIFD